MSEEIFSRPLLMATFNGLPSHFSVLTTYVQLVPAKMIATAILVSRNQQTV